VIYERGMALCFVPFFWLLLHYVAVGVRGIGEYSFRKSKTKRIAGLSKSILAKDSQI
jgi:hypothetical protein